MKKAVVFIMMMILAFPAISIYAQPENTAPHNYLPSVSNFASYSSFGPVSAAHIPENEIIIPIASCAKKKGVNFRESYLDYHSDILVMEEENGFVTYTVDIPREGRYAFLLEYAALPGSMSNIELTVLINGEVPFREAQSCSFRRLWVYAESERVFDNRGNMLRPSSKEYFIWRESYFTDKEGFYTEPFAFLLAQGTHEITIRSIREPVAIRSFKLTPPPKTPSYAELSASGNTNANAKPVTALAIDASLRDSPSILPVSDLTNPYLEPFSLTNITYNTMGGDMWNLPGQSIYWTLDIPESSYYALSFVYKQDAVIGLPVARTLTINGRIPFEEAKTVIFPYGDDWQRTAVSVNGEEAVLYFERGRHEIGLTVTLGQIASLCQTVSEISNELSSLYTQIVMITGPNPDNMRDYRIDSRLPNIIPDFARLAKRLDEVTDAITELGSGRNDALTISIMASQLHDFVTKPDSIPGRMGRFKDNVVNLAYWVLISSDMPLALYSVTAAPAGTQFGPVKPGFFGSIWFSIIRFFSSFTTRAEMVGNSYSKNEDNLIEVWGAYGKDYSEVIKRLADEIFTPQTGIKVNYNIISSDNLMFFNIAAKTGPDICLNIERGYPLDFGLRGAAADISQMPGFAEFETRFSNMAMTPRSFGGKVYGFPVTQGIPVLYVRTDIFNDLGLEVPRTWDDFYAIIGALGVYNLQVSPAGDLMSYFVLQNGGNYFDDGLTKCLLDEPVGIAALTIWSDLFTLHGAPYTSDFFNRFRTGEMPIGISDYSFYNILDFAALEIKGNWAMYPIPGTLREDGTVNNTITTSGNSGFITNSRPERHENAWAFVKWFMSEEIQTRFCLEMEAIFGTPGRYNTAIVASQASIPWDKHSYDIIMHSLSNAQEIPGIPGGYYVGRYIGNAHNEIVLKGESPRRAMRKYIEVINDEIQRKREELGLN